MFDEYQRIIRLAMKKACFLDDDIVGFCLVLLRLICVSHLSFIDGSLVCFVLCFQCFCSFDLMRWALSFCFARWDTWDSESVCVCGFFQNGRSKTWRIWRPCNF